MTDNFGRIFFHFPDQMFVLCSYQFPAFIKNIIFIFLVSCRRQPRGGEKVGRPCQTIFSSELASSFSSLPLPWIQQRIQSCSDLYAIFPYLISSVADPNPDPPDPPDPHAFGPPRSGFGYISQRNGSGSFYI